MKINIGTTQYSSTRPSRFMQREGRVFVRYEEEINRSASAVGLFDGADLDWLWVDMALYRRDDRNKPVPTNCSRTSGWKHQPKKREYTASCDLDLSLWDERKRKQLGLPPLPEAGELVAPVRECVARVIFEVAQALRRPQQAIDAFAARIGLGSVTPTAEPPSAAMSEAPFPVALELSFAESCFEPEAGFALRRAIRELVETALGQHQLGQFDGTSSGGGSYDLGFMVADGEWALQLIKQVLRDAGYDLAMFRFDIDE